MIKVTGKAMKSEIANAIQKYNGAEIYSYSDDLLPFENCWYVNSSKYSIKEFCESVVDNVKEKVKRNENLPLNMIIIYTNVSDIVKIGTLNAYAARIEEVEKLVTTVVLMTK